MKLISLDTENFKKLGTRSVQFADGVNFIVGGNGEGKSTVLRAVAVALFGPTMLPGVSDDIPTRGTSTWSLSLKFRHLGKDVKVERGKSKASVTVEGKLEANGQSAVTKYLEELLNISARDYNLLIHSRQGETNYVINYGATALQRKVEEFAGIAEIDKIVVEASKVAREQANRVEWLQDRVPSAEIQRANESELNRLTKEFEAQTYALKVLQATKPPVEPQKPSFDLSEERAKLRRYSSYLNAKALYWRDKEHIEQQIAELPEDIKVPDTDKLEAELKALKEQRKEHLQLVQLKLETEQKIYSLKEALEVLESKEFTVPDNLEEIRGELKKVEKRREDLRTLEGSLISKVDGLETSIDKGVCNSCGTILAKDLDKMEEELAESRKDLDKVKKDLASITSELKALEEQISYSNNQLRLKEENQEAISKVKQDLGGVEPVEVTGDDEALQKVIFTVESQLTKLEETKEEANSLLRKRSRLERQLADLEPPKPVEETTEERIGALEVRMSKYEKDLAAWGYAAGTLEQKVSSKQRDVNALEDTLKQIKRTVNEGILERKELEESKKEGEVAEKLAKYLRTRRSAYLSEVWDSIMTQSSAFLDSTTRGWMTETSIDDGKFMFREDGAWVPAVETSGAQSAFLGSALRIGLNKALYRGNTFLAFDEPTEAMTEENARNLVTGLSETSDQVIIISHKQTDQSLADNIIEV